MSLVNLYPLHSLPHSDVSETGPSIGSPVFKGSNAQASKLFRNVGIDSAVSDFGVAAPFFVGKIFANDRPGGVVVAVDVVGTDQLPRGWRALHGRTGLRGLEGYLYREAKV